MGLYGNQYDYIIHVVLITTFQPPLKYTLTSHSERTPSLVQ